MLNSSELKRLRIYRLERIRQQLIIHDLAAIVLTDPINIRYATDSTNMQVFSLHVANRYTYIANDGPLIHFEFDECEYLIPQPNQIDELRPAIAWAYFFAGPRHEEKAIRWAAEIADLVRNHGGGNTRLAVDRLGVAALHALSAQGMTVSDGQGLMENARKIKSAEEVKAMKLSIAACEGAIEKMQDAMQPGITENQLWSVLHQQNIASGGEWIETRFLTSGSRTNPWSQECSEKVIREGELVAFDTDLIGRYGYCTDISRIWLCGAITPTKTQKELYKIAFDQLHKNIDHLKIGRSFLEYSRICGNLSNAYQPQRYGCLAHGIGLCDEYPILFYEADSVEMAYDGILEEGMTLCVETYIGKVGGSEGVKLEEQVLFNANGPEKLSSYPFETSLLKI